MSAREHLSKKQFPFKTIDYPLTEKNAPYNENYHSVRAVDPETGIQIGDMTWDKRNGRLAMIKVEDGLRRQGIATAMWNHANSVSPVTHSELRTPEGDAWAQKIGGDLPKNKACETCNSIEHSTKRHDAACTVCGSLKHKTKKHPG
jgi:hypothetical protein